MINSVEKKYVDGIFDNYKMTLSNGQVWSVPLDPANSDYQAIQEWVAEGNTITDNGDNE